jgi:hypothetical protein
MPSRSSIPHFIPNDPVVPPPATRITIDGARRAGPPGRPSASLCRSSRGGRMPYIVDFENVSTTGLE